MSEITELGIKGAEVATIEINGQKIHVTFDMQADGRKMSYKLESDKPIIPEVLVVALRMIETDICEEFNMAVDMSPIRNLKPEMQ